MITSTEFLDLVTLPQRIAFIGGGYIAFEFAHVARRAGAKPVILQRRPRVLNGFEPSLVDVLVEVSASIGIDVRLNVAVRSIEARPGALRILGVTGDEGLRSSATSPSMRRGGWPILTIGARCRGHRATKKGVAVHQFLQSPSNPAVYAVGDCADAGGYADADRRRRRRSRGAKSARGQLLIGSTFLGLQHCLHHSGALHDGSRRNELANAACARVHEGDSTQWYSSRRIQARRSRLQVLIEEETGRILGAHVSDLYTEEL